MTTLYIDDKEVTVAPGTSILEACRKHGVDVPYFCYHPELTVAANCRMCLVEVEGWNKPAASCCTPVSEGMKVRTQTETLAEDRRMVMEYLLIHHPLDCPVCDQGGACKLQDYTVEHGASRGRYAEPKRAVINYNLGPFVNTSMTRCIHCTRCVRFAEEIAGTGDIGVMNRGDHMTIAGIVEETLESELSGNLPDICPVGALLDKPSHDVARPWELTHHQSTCTQCPNGCDIEIDSRGTEVVRIRPVEGSPEPWLCDRGRYVYDAFRSNARILEPRVRIDGKLVATDWDEAMGRAEALLKGKRVGIIFSPYWTIEGLTSIRLMRDAAFPAARVAFDLHRRDMRPFAFEEGFSMTTAQIEAADQVVILGSDLRQRLPLLMQRLRKRGNNGRPVARIGAMNYRTNMQISSDAIIRPRDWPAVIARAMQQVTDLGKTAAGMKEWMAAVSERHEAGKILADALIADTCALLVGEEIRSHEDAAALIHGLDLLMRACGHAEEGADGRNLIPEGMNAQLLSAVFGDVRVGVGDIFAAASAGELDALVLVGSDPLGDGLFPAAAKAALDKVPLVQIGAISGEIGERAEVQLPAAAYSEIEGSFVNMEGRIRQARQPIRSLGQERPMWKVMMRLVQQMGNEPPAINLGEVCDAAKRFMPALTEAMQAGKDAVLVRPARNRDAVALPRQGKQPFALDVISRYSMYREGMWARASKLLSEAAELHALDDLLVHPETLAEQGLKAGELTVKSFLGEHRFNIGLREDVSPGVLFISRRGIAGDMSDVTTASIEGGKS
ncbi:MAG TPA: NADH-quinone oxidoreductase subunit NuoG [Mariprofundaceae bacterium]|nr:NADH-quinone oxidoreductase subunit NuoG [Mariprofundaceae bacterium]